VFQCIALQGRVQCVLFRRVSGVGGVTRGKGSRAQVLTREGLGLGARARARGQGVGVYLGRKKLKSFDKN